MPSFRPAERERILAKLRATGAELLAGRGLRKTTLDELVGPSGIAKATFYSFFDSKEALYLDLMQEQISDIAPRLHAAATSGRDARQSLMALMQEIIDVLETNPLYRRLLTHPDEMEAVGDRIGPAEIDRVQREMVQPLLDVIAAAQRDGAIVDADPATVFGVIRGVLLLPLHRDEFAEGYRDVLHLMINTVAAGLTR